MKTTTLIAGLGVLISPSFVGAAVGALAGAVFSEKARPKSKIFVSFDFKNDRKLKDLFLNQSRNPMANFAVIDHSLKEAAPEKTWKVKAEKAIVKSDILVIILGENTHRSHGVLSEIEIAKIHNKKIVQIIGSKKRGYVPIDGAGPIYSWNWKNLQRLLT